MKFRFIVILMMCVFFASGIQAQSKTPPPARQIVKEARQQAQKTSKNVLIIFHASWCGWCHRMDALMTSPACKKLFTDNYVIRHIDVLERAEKKALENPGGQELLKKYHGDEQGIPYWFILDKDGRLLADSRIKPANADPAGNYNNSGCPATQQEVDYFIRVLKNTSSLNTSQLAVIQKSFLAKEQ